MADTVIREGMACEYRPDLDVTLTFKPTPRKPYRYKVTCSGCDESWETDARPEDYPTRAEVEAQSE
ncbi:hypothetical protein [Streptomyces asiaticus]|uniref:hypothetical protein n=1 Tax=Streptomyces asiaticus TaxID=114695 RepID=UPI003F67598C